MTRKRRGPSRKRRGLKIREFVLQVQWKKSSNKRNSPDINIPPSIIVGFFYILSFYIKRTILGFPPLFIFFIARNLVFLQCPKLAQGFSAFAILAGELTIYGKS